MMKALGSAQHPMEDTIESVIREAPLFQGGAGMVYGPVSGGISNENWRVKNTQGAGDWFVKVPGNGTEMFIDRITAIDASKKAAAAGLGPRVYDDLADRGVEINDFLPGHRPSNHGDFADLETCKTAIGAYRILHGLPALGLTKTVFDMIDEHVGQVRDLGAPMYKDSDWILLNTAIARDAMNASGLDLVTSFNDPMPGNFMIGEDGSIMLIDYEYASMNDRCYDFGIWFGEMFFSPERELELIEEYFGEVRSDIVSRVIVHKALADVKWCLWSMVQLKVSRLRFDFHKYGMWKKMRARAIMEHPDWSTHLRKL
ncbi:putative choline kinase involved in LPS biosynthesis [Hoeflea phototrophica DFL-43]|jgi:thiamine kinase-like enzyme|uniref:Putative choline kinase involved in LPS biosynthesis n=2 Tax=Hoeflea TaxID=274591 RepID=A9CZL1_HOEPD|nr:phosphotransferase [Hoeflea phototrophica]EDQ34789.2 putative choline kinase involved in LPS biosynthesis [Hoeflea phototrophica DFL-43]